MPFNELKRQYSWPPFILKLRSTDNKPDNTRTTTFSLPPIDEDPISHFLSSPEDEDIDDYYLNDDAGIETPTSRSLPIREISPSSLQRFPHLSPTSSEDSELDPETDTDEEDTGLEMPMTLKEFTRRHNEQMSNGRKSRTGQHNDSPFLSLYPPLSPDQQAFARGRARIKILFNRKGSRDRDGRGRGRARTLSARRPQSWRQPSPDIWMIEEEKEEDLVEMDMDQNVNTKGLGISLPSPGDSDKENRIPRKEVPKKGKHVRFAE